MNQKPIEVHPLSYSQKSIWLSCNFIQQKNLYHLAAKITFNLSLSPKKLESIIYDSIKNHPQLMTRFCLQKGEPIQLFYSKQDNVLTWEEVDTISDSELEKKIQNIVSLPFDLEKGPLTRFHSFTFSPAKSILIVCMHHIIIDGWSCSIFYNEIITRVLASLGQQKRNLLVSELTYRDYIDKQHEILNGSKGEKLFNYWKQELGTVVKPIKFPYTIKENQSHSWKGEVQKFRLPDTLFSINKFTPFTILLGIMHLFLYRLTLQKKIYIAIPMLNRIEKSYINVIGNFENTVIIKADFTKPLTFLDLLSQINNKIKNAQLNQLYPLLLLKEKLRIQGTSFNPLLTNVYVSHAKINSNRFFKKQKNKIIGRKQNDNLIEFHPIELFNVPADFGIQFYEINKDKFFELHYNCNIFTRENIGNLINMIKTISHSIIADPRILVDKINIISPEEKEYLLNVSYKPEPLHHALDFATLFENQVKNTPDKKAIQYKTISITYSELNIRANQLAHYLLRTGINNEDRIGVYQPHSPDVIIALLAIMKIGATYVPLASHIPEKRIQYIIENCGIKTIIISGERIPSLTNSPRVNIINMQDKSLILSQFPTENLNKEITLSSPAYIIYTSGSTGFPKGVVIEHKGIGNLHQAQMTILKIHNSEKILQFADIDFDASIWEIIMALFSGNTLIMCDEEIKKDPLKLEELINKEKVTIATLPPVILSHLSTEVPSLRKVISAGEDCSMEILKKWVTDKRVLFNAYGPTEGTVCATIGELHKTDATITIGKPIPNVEILIMDENLNLVPRFVTGEICISGINIARGYIHPENIPFYPFIKHPIPHSSRHSRENAMLYRTGDIGRWDDKGNIIFLGRKDRQIKLLGHRIELSEIETVLNNMEEIIDSTVLLKNKTSPSLVAFVRTHSQKINQNTLIPKLKKILPSYMMPAHIIFIDSWPLTPHKKKDLNKLYEIMNENTYITERPKISPRNPIEESILEICLDVLHLTEMSIDDDFLKLGGNSIQMTQIISRIKELLSIDIPIRIIFENPTIIALSGQIEYIQNTLTSTIPAPSVIKNKETNIPLSQSQERMWFLHQLEPESIAYNILVAIKLKKKLNENILRKSIHKIIQRHDILRTTFAIKDGNPVQIINKSLDNYFKVIDLTNAGKDESDQIRYKTQNEEARYLFNLKKGPLIRITLIKISVDEHILILNMHHIISDQWSVGNLANELNIYYTSYIKDKEPELPILFLQYSDFSYWQQKYFTDNNLDQDIMYWKNQLYNLPVLTLPQDKTRPVIQTYSGANVIIPIDDSIIAQIKMLSSKHHSTSFMLLLSIFIILLYRYTGMKDIPIGIPNANRNFSSIENLIGTFVNTLVIRTIIDDNVFFIDFLKQVKQICLEAFTHKDLPFNKIVEIMNLKRDTSHLPLVQIFFNIANAPITDTLLDELSWEIVELNEIGVQFDLTLTIELKKMKQIVFSYNKDLFRHESIQQMAQHYHTLIHELLKNPGYEISKIPILQNHEINQIFYKWNETGFSYMDNSTVSEIFEHIAQKKGNNTAVFFNNISISYKELNLKSNIIAHHLKSKGVGPESIIGLHINRSINVLIGLFGIMKAGAAFLPLDPEYPKERLSFMITDSKISFLLSEKSLHDQLTFNSNNIIYIDDILEVKFHGHTSNLPQTAKTENTVYIIYTSGSTGKPKGVQITHQSLLNFLFSMKEKPGMNEHDHLLALTPYSFDIAYLELFLPLITGSLMTLASSEERQDGFLLKTLIEKVKPTIVQATPSTWQMLIDAGWNNFIINTVLCGGEALPPYLSKKLFLRTNQLWNMYGPTETTIWSTVYNIPYKNASVLIGKPIANTQVYILDSYHNPVPIGIAGELYIGGDGLAKGYLYQKEYTREKFISVQLPGGEKVRIYRTGDIACFKRDGNIEFIGRKDTQVKYHGYRIELGEIDYWISQIPMISRTITVMRKSESGEQKITSYIISKDPSIQQDVRDQIIVLLKEKLPHYMIPAFIIFLKEFPLTPNKKIDKDKLPSPSFHENKDTQLELPEDEIEKKLLSIWRKILGINNISVTDNFFNLGGYSLLAVRLTSEINKTFNILMPLRLLFTEPTPKGLARLLRNHLYFNDPNAIDFVDGDILFLLQKGKPRIPLFVVIGKAGNEDGIYSYFTNLIPFLGSDLPLYGLRPKGLRKPAEAYKAVSEIAFDYIQEIKKIQPHGPYFIAGECIGGIIAYETAQQLTASGEEVKRLILLDTFYPTGQTKQEMYFIKFKLILKKFRNRFNIAKTLPLPVLYKRLFKYFRRVSRKYISRRALYKDDNRFNHVKTNYYLLSQNYKPKIYNGGITLIINEKDYKINPFLGWQNLFTFSDIDKSSFDIHIVHGDHRNRLILYGKETGNIIIEIINTHFTNTPSL